MLDRASIEDCLEFLGRADLKGREVAAFVNVTNRLHHLREVRLAEEKAAADAAANPPIESTAETPLPE